MKKEVKDSTANIITVGGVSLMLLIAGLPLIPSLTILGGTVAGCAYLTHNKKQKNWNITRLSKRGRYYGVIKTINE